MREQGRPVLHPNAIVLRMRGQAGVDGGRAGSMCALKPMTRPIVVADRRWRRSRSICLRRSLLSALRNDDVVGGLGVRGDESRGASPRGSPWCAGFWTRNRRRLQPSGATNVMRVPVLARPCANDLVPAPRPGSGIRRRRIRRRPGARGLLEHVDGKRGHRCRPCRGAGLLHVARAA